MYRYIGVMCFLSWAMHRSCVGHILVIYGSYGPMGHVLVTYGLCMSLTAWSYMGRAWVNHG